MKFEIQDRELLKVAENVLRTSTLGGKWQWKSVEKGDASPSGYKIKSCIFCNFRENSLKSWISNFMSEFYDFCIKTLFSPLNSKLNKLQSMRSSYIIYR